MEVAKTTNPLIVIKNVLAYHTDAEIIQHITAQNKYVLQEIKSDAKLRVHYRKKARNSLECHLVLELSPEAHKAFLEAGYVYIRLQRRPVTDQSPLTQGHTKALCQEKEHSFASSRQICQDQN